MVCIFTNSLSLSIVIILFNFYFFLFTLVSATKLHNFSETCKTLSPKMCFASLADSPFPLNDITIADEK